MKSIAIDTLFADHRREIESFLTKKCNCPETAADLTQEVYLRLLEKQTLTNESNVRAYLYKTAKNIAINHQISDQRRQKLWQSASEPTEKINTISPERVTSDTQKLAELNSALSELPLLCQQVFILTRIKGMKQKEVATKLGIHITTVEKNLSKAVRHCFASVLEMEARKK